MSLLVLALVIALLVVAAVALRSGTREMWENSGPGQWFSNDPTGNIAPQDSEFESPRNDGDPL